MTMNILIDNLENQKTSENRCTIVKRKKLFKALYEQWYDDLMAEENGEPGAVVEIGTGPGFIKEKYPNVLCSDIFPVSTADFVCDGLRLPLKPQSVKRIIMINVFHHVKDSKLFLMEMYQCLMDAGCVTMIEPYNTLWGDLSGKIFTTRVLLRKSRNGRLQEMIPCCVPMVRCPGSSFRETKSSLEWSFPDWKLLRSQPTHSEATC